MSTIKIRKYIHRKIFGVSYFNIQYHGLKIYIDIERSDDGYFKYIIRITPPYSNLCIIKLHLSYNDIDNILDDNFIDKIISYIHNPYELEYTELFKEREYIKSSFSFIIKIINVLKYHAKSLTDNVSKLYKDKNDRSITHTIINVEESPFIYSIENLKSIRVNQIDKAVYCITNDTKFKIMDINGSEVMVYKPYLENMII